MTNILTYNYGIIVKSTIEFLKFMNKYITLLFLTVNLNKVKKIQASLSIQ